MAELQAGFGPVDRRVGARIRTRRERLGLSVMTLAMRLGRPASLIEDYEAGRARAGAETLMLLTQILEVEIGYFLRALGEDTPPPTEIDRIARDRMMS